MIDWIKMDITYLYPGIQTNGLLHWLPLVDTITGELNPSFSEYKRKKLRPEWIAEYRGLLFEIFIHPNTGKKSLYMSGSLHKYFYGGRHNYNDFTFDHLYYVIKSLHRDFGIDPERTKIHHVEAGVNMPCLKYSSRDIIENIMCHSGKGAPPEQFKYEHTHTKSEYIRMNRQRYCIKIYDKALHYYKPYEILRYEVKYPRMADLKKSGITHLIHLIDFKKLSYLGKDLLKKWEETILFDWSINKSRLNKREIIKLKDYQNKNYWRRLYKDSRRNEFRQELNKYYLIVSQYSDSIHKYIYAEINKNWCNLLVSVDVPIDKNGCNLHISGSTEIYINKCNLTNNTALSCTPYPDPESRWIHSASMHQMKIY